MTSDVDGFDILSSFAPATSIQEAKKQISDLFSQNLSAGKIQVELIPLGGNSALYPGDEKPVNLAELGVAEVVCQHMSNGFYLLLKVNDRFNSVIKCEGCLQQPEITELNRNVLTMAGAIRFILNSGILAEERMDLLLHGERVSEAFEQYQQYFKFIFENTPLPFQTLDSHGTIVGVNEAWLDVLGYQEGDVTGRLFNQFLADGQEERFGQCFEQLAENGEIKNFEVEVVKNDATPIQIQLVGIVARGTDGKVLNSHFLFQDVSGKNKIKELILQSERLSTIAGLAAGIAHELNTPLSGIMQSVQLIEMFLDPRNKANVDMALENGVDLNKLQSYLQKQDLDYFIDGIRGSALKASRIIRSLLDFSRPTDKEFEIVRLPDLIELVISLIQTDYDLKKKYDVINTRLETEYDSNAPFIRCVPGEIEQVILNIVKNSVHALGKNKIPEPHVCVRTSKRGDSVRIEVEDNGPGISEEVKKHAFDPFYTTKSTGEGTGLGLAVSYTFVVEKHKGRIWIDSTYVKGTRVIVELPLGID